MAADASSSVVFGVDFSSAPGPRKPITVARTRLVRADQGTGIDAGSAAIDPRTVVLWVDDFLAVESLEAFERFLRMPGPWIAGFDFPFGLPRELVEALAWPLDWPGLVRHFAALPREAIRERLRAFCDARPAGGKFAHRATDRPAGSSPSMKWVNPPVAWMFHAGAPRLLAAGVHLPGLHGGDVARVALEAYPGLLARSVTRQSYKSDDPRAQDEARAQARRQILDALLAGRHRLGLPVRFSSAAAARLDDDPRADWLDAVLCAVQAGWAALRGPGFGLPVTIDPLEGWIVGADHAAGA
jgi:hypothetical protein